MLKVGDYVIYQEQVCQIKEQKINEFTNLESFILVPVTDSSLKLNVPVNNPNIKNLMTKEEIKNLIALMPSIPLIEIEDKLLENEYKRLYHSGSKEDLIRIIKTTYRRNQERLNNNKKISEKDNKYFTLAENLLYSEIATVFGISLEEAKEYILANVQN
mgnify:FL=1